MKTADSEPDVKILQYDQWVDYLDWCEKHELRATTKGYLLWLEENDEDVSE